MTGIPTQKLEVISRRTFLTGGLFPVLTLQSLTDYNVQTASQTIEDFVIGDLSTWYVRRSRERIKDALPALYSILVNLSKLLAPFMPYVAEEMYMNLAGENSVHLSDFPP